MCRELGPPEVPVGEEAPDPAPTPGRVVIAVEAAGVNFVDALFGSGKYQIKPPLPFTPGGEVAGPGVWVGSDVTDVVPGQRVLASIGLGGYASAVPASVDPLSHIPTTLDAPRAA